MPDVVTLVVDLREGPAVYAVLDEGCNPIVHGSEWAVVAEAKYKTLGYETRYTPSEPKSFKGLSGGTTTLGI